MSLRGFFNRLAFWNTASRKVALRETKPQTPADYDAFTAIQELSKAVQNNPDAIEIYLALGNLYRQQGEFEKAAQTRNTLIVRPNLSPSFRAKAMLELGRDYRRSGLYNRAEKAFEEAKNLGANLAETHLELAQLYEDIGNFSLAATHYAALHENNHKSYCLSKTAENFFQSDKNEALRLFTRATTIFPAAVEAWCGLIVLALLDKNWSKFKKTLRNALNHCHEDMHFFFFEALLPLLPCTLQPLEKTDKKHEVMLFPLPELSEQDLLLCVTSIIECIKEQEPNPLRAYYAALLSQCLVTVTSDSSDVTSTAANSAASQPSQQAYTEWLDKALALQHNFWPARLEILQATAPQQQHATRFDEQLAFFINQGKNVRRFVCNSCGTRNAYLFFKCPRCRSLRSARFRMTLLD